MSSNKSIENIVKSTKVNICYFLNLSRKLNPIVTMFSHVKRTGDKNMVSLFCFHLFHQITNRSALAVRQLCIIIITILS